MWHGCVVGVAAFTARLACVRTRARGAARAHGRGRRRAAAARVGEGGRGALGAVAQGRARVEKKDSRAGRARGGEREGRAERAGREKRGRRDLRRIRGARSATRSADHLCSVGCVRGARVNRVMDTGVGSGLREVGRKRV